MKFFRKLKCMFFFHEHLLVEKDNVHRCIHCERAVAYTPNVEVGEV